MATTCAVAMTTVGALPSDDPGDFNRRRGTGEFGHGNIHCHKRVIAKHGRRGKPVAMVLITW